jgi:hypothetical protein
LPPLRDPGHHIRKALSLAVVTAFSILLFRERLVPSGFFLNRAPGERFLLAGVEVKATLYDTNDVNK